MKITKKTLIEKYIINHGSITSLEAISEFWATRLAAVINTLKAEGWEFEPTQRVRHKTGSYYGKYILKNTPDNYNNNGIKL